MLRADMLRADMLRADMLRADMLRADVPRIGMSFIEPLTTHDSDGMMSSEWF
jgi:hypothetical protein